MNTPGPSGNRSAERLIEIIAAGLLNMALSAQPVSAADYFSVPEVEFLESVTTPSMTDGKSPWTCWKYGSMPINYGTGALNHARYHAFRLPVCPPLYDPTFGFRFTCWRQLSYERRCYLPDTVWRRPRIEPPSQEPGRAQMGTGTMPRSGQANPRPAEQSTKTAERPKTFQRASDLPSSAPDDDSTVAIPLFRIDGSE